MEMNEEAKLALQIIETTGSNLFLTGKAGTGKTTFLRELKRSTSKRNVVLAPTGIAAINAEGVTIHSFFQLPFAPYVPDTSVLQSGRFKFSKQKIKIMRSLDLIVIDEISMVRADLLDAVDSVLRHYRRCDKPFGGVQLLLIGDLGQLAPWQRMRSGPCFRNIMRHPISSVATPCGRPTTRWWNSHMCIARATACS